MEDLILPTKLKWHNQFTSALADSNIDGHFFLKDDFSLFSVYNHALVIHLVSLDNQFTPQHLISMQQMHLDNGIKLIHLWEDVWLNKPLQVLARISSLLGLNKRIHGRETSIKKIDKSVAVSFLNENHLQGFVSCRYKLGLFKKDVLVSVATFAALRKMNHEENYKSAELIRFAIKTGYSVVGGLSKLISHFYHLHQPNDLMTYADRDWSAGEAYHKLNFIKTNIIAPQYFSIDSNLSRSLIKEDSSTPAKVFNTGSLKYILKF
ncbi:hypothetical protein [Pedobacter agri]|uniref:hypothetical protein n=1 Tax=Pedobacter agri TaxID=454586 RepID=UPI00292CE8B6|nr:hypothetical protein [Pedobacter agri]